MSKEITIETIEDRFDVLFEEVDKLNQAMLNANYVSLKQIQEAYEESKN